MSCEVCLYGAYSGCPCCGPEEPEEESACEGAASGCEGCGDCIERVERWRTVTARAPRSAAGRARRARNGIKPGDRIVAYSAFEYQINGGPRTGYFHSEWLAS